MIRQFYTSQDPTYQKSAQEYLHNLQKEAFAWELAPHLLASQVGFTILLATGGTSGKYTTDQGLWSLMLLLERVLAESKPSHLQLVCLEYW